MTNRHHTMVSILSVGESNRISYDEETEEFIGGVEQLDGDIANLTKTAKTPGGISLFSDKDKTTYKSTAQLLREISEIYGDLDDKVQARLLEKLAGKRQGQILSAIIDHFDIVEESLKDMENSAGSAMAEMGIVTESLTYKLNALKETGVGIAQNLFKREDFGNVIDGLTSILEIVDKLTEGLGFTGTVGAGLAGGGLYAILKNKDLTKALSLFPKYLSEFGGAGVATGFEEIATAVGLSTTALSGLLGVAVGIPAAFAFVDWVTTSFDELDSATKKAYGDYQETTQNIKSLNEELKTTKARIDELEGKKTLDLSEKQELDKLKRANELLERRIELEKRLADSQKQVAINEAKKVFTEAGENGRSITDEYDINKSRLGDLQQKRGSIMAKMSGLDVESKEYKKYQEQLEGVDHQIESVTNTMTEQNGIMANSIAELESLDALYDENGHLVEGAIDLYRAYNEDMLYSGTVTEQAYQKRKALNNILRDDAYSDSIAKLREYIKANKDTTLSEQELQNVLGQDAFADLNTKLAESGFSLDDLRYKMLHLGDAILEGNLREKADEAFSALKQTDKLDTKQAQTIQAGLEFNAGQSEVEAALREMQAWESTLDFNVDTDDLVTARTIITQLQSKYQELNQPMIMNVDTSKLSAGKKKLVELLQQYNQLSTEKDLKVGANADTSGINKDMEKLRSQIESVSASVGIELDTGSINSLKNQIQSDSLPIELVPQLEKQPKSLLGEFDKQMIDIAIGDTSAVDGYQPEDKTLSVNAKMGNTSAVSSYTPPTKTMYVKTVRLPEGGGGRVVQVNGSAHAYGTALAGGYWGVGRGGRALMGELGISYAPLYGDI